MKKPHVFVCFLGVLALAIATCPAQAADHAKSPGSVQPPVGALSLTSQRKPGQTDRVEVHLEVGGETTYTGQGKPQREKMSVVRDLDYVEKTLETPAGPRAVWRSVRDYRKVSADVKVGDGQFKPTLAPEHRLIAVDAAPQTTLLFSPRGSLTRTELDAIHIHANSLLLDRLLPEKPVAIGDRWPHSEQLMAAMLGLDEVAKTTVYSTLKEVTDTLARFEFAGRVEGTIYGVSTVIETRGRYRLVLRTGRIDWLGMLIKEERPASSVEDGLDVVSRLAIRITPAPEAASLADEALAKLALKPTPELTCLTYESPGGGWQCLYDRRWYIHHQRPKSDVAVLRLVDRGAVAGQCNLSSLPQREPEKLVSLEEFQDDVRRALGKSFGEFVEAGRSANAANCRVYRVVVHGTSADIAMRWIYYLVADPQGRQVAFTFTVEQKFVDRFAEADKSLVQSLRFVDKKRD
jgi:hypothetical protein